VIEPPAEKHCVSCLFISYIFGFWCLWNILGTFDIVNMKQTEKKVDIEIKNDSASLPTETFLSVGKTCSLQVLRLRNAARWCSSVVISRAVGILSYSLPLRKNNNRGQSFLACSLSGSDRKEMVSTRDSL
jgi:hypothetical protein